MSRFFEALARVHLVGIGGSGMSGLAEILLASGKSVSGSDLRETDITRRLRGEGATIYVGHAASNVASADVVVISSSIAGDNPEVLAASKVRLPIVHRSEMLAELMRLKSGIVVAGTHGKTTTTSLLASALIAAELDPTVVVGGIVNKLSSSTWLGSSEWFVAEADESDSSFLRLTPTIAVITNVDVDHLDHYDSFDAIVQAFSEFVSRVPFYGVICACSDDPGVQRLMPDLRRHRLVTFGLSNGADVCAENISFSGMSTRFEPTIHGKRYSAVHLQMPGRHNILNALASLSVASVLQVNIPTVIDALNDFHGVLHRSTVAGSVGTVTVIDDYAHNPTKIQAALCGLREGHPDAHICAVFQPHRYTRLHHMRAEFLQSFWDADSVIVTPVHTAGESPIPGVTHESIADDIGKSAKAGKSLSVSVADNLSQATDLAAAVARQHMKAGTVLVVTLGAGDVPSVGKSLIELLTIDISIGT